MKQNIVAPMQYAKSLNKQQIKPVTSQYKVGCRIKVEQILKPAKSLTLMRNESQDFIVRQQPKETHGTSYYSKETKKDDDNFDDFFQLQQKQKIDVDHMMFQFHNMKVKSQQFQQHIQSFIYSVIYPMINLQKQPAKKLSSEQSNDQKSENSNLQSPSYLSMRSNKQTDSPYIQKSSQAQTYQLGSLAFSQRWNQFSSANLNDQEVSQQQTENSKK